MRLRRLALLVPVIALLAIAPTPALADHCGAAATITPSSGPPGTHFVFETNLGAPSDLHLYRDSTLVRSVFLDDSDVVSYAIETGSGDAGSWRARAEVRGQTGCAAEATFTVVGTPDTSTEPVSSPAGPLWLLLALAGAAFATALMRSTTRSGTTRRP
jgi:hypothetical protein